MRANLPPREAARLEALRQYRILDTAPEQAYDDITSLAAFICGTPIALISLVDADRQWFKSRVGLDALETSRDASFCAHTILGDHILVVKDAHQDDRFRENPLVTGPPHIRFYAGVPLRTPDHAQIGSLCVIGHEPGELSEVQSRTLEALGRQVVLQLELRRISTDLASALEKIDLMEQLIPICSYCKGIRNDRGYWQSVEKFIQSYADVEFSHGVCDKCMQEYFPEVAAAEQGLAAAARTRQADSGGDTRS
jgi:GAF domain-containing protein